MSLYDRFLKTGERLLTIALLPFLPIELIARTFGIEEGIEPTRKGEADIEVFVGQVKTFDDIAIIIDKDKKTFHTWLDERIEKYRGRNVRIIVEPQTK